ncbi:MAG: sulfatase-like hydrolase/transferase [Acidobacteria bacterium]|nr:sulfatase-like hydrolase/transferase [Acidobacteriota bacterium]
MSDLERMQPHSYTSKYMASSLNRRRFGATLTAGLLGSRAARAQQPPNVLVILTSEMRADALSSMGAAIAKTPAIDALAKEGCLLRHSITAIPESARGGMALLTGRYPKQRSVEGDASQAFQGFPTLTELFAKSGYKTGLIGAPPRPVAKLSADTVKLYPEPDYKAFLDENYAHFEGDPHRPMQPLTHGPEGPPPWDVGATALPATGFPTGWIGSQTREFFNAHKEGGPWCCLTTFWKPREPYILPMPWAKRYNTERIPAPNLPATHPTPPTASDQPRDYAVGSQAPLIRLLMQSYFGSVAYVDDEVRAIVRELKILKQFDNTIIAVVGDCGHMLADHGRMFGAVPYEGALRTPGVLRFPAGIKPNGRIEAPVSTTAILPTLLELAGVKSNARFDAPSLAPALQDSLQMREGDAFAAMGFEAVQTAGWKLVEAGDHPTWEPQLFDLSADPGETNNLYGKPEGAQAQKDLAKKLDGWRKRLG